MRALIDNNPEYQAITVMRVDWDTYRNADIVEDLAVPRRSTLVMFSRGRETGRVVAETGSDAIEALFKTALQ